MARSLRRLRPLLRIMTHAHQHTPQTIRTHQRIDRMMADTVRRFITVALSASGLTVIICCLNSLR